MTNSNNEGVRAVRKISIRLLFLSVFQIFVSSLMIQSDFRWFTFDDGPGRNSPFVNSVPKFSDFYQIFSYAQNSDPYTYTKSGYPPFGHEFLAPLTFFNSDVALMIFLGASFGLLIASVVTVVANSINVFGMNYSDFLSIGLLCFSFPILFAADRGNIDILIIGMLIVVIDLHHRGKRTFASIILGLAMAIKIYPIVLLLFFLRFKNGTMFTIRALGVAAFATVFATWRSVGLSRDSISMILASVSGDGGIVLEPKYGAWSTSITGFISALRQSTSGIFPSAATDIYFLKLRIVLLILVLLFCAAIALFARSKTEMMIGSVSLALLLPTISYQYKAALLLLPVMISIQENSAVLMDKKLVWPFALAMGPTVWWFFGDGLANSSSLITVLSLLYIVFSVGFSLSIRDRRLLFT